MLQKERNALSTLRQKYAHCQVEIVEGHVTSLHIYAENLQSLPPEVTEFPKLQTLGLQQNGLEQIPTAIFNLHSLKKLDLRYNQIHDIPRDICALEQLERIDLDNNAITHYPIVSPS